MARARDAVAEVLGTSLTPLLVRSIVATLPTVADREIESLDVVSGYELLQYAASGVRIFSPTARPELLEALYRRVTAGRPLRPVTRVVTVTSDADVVAAQEASRRILRGLFKPIERTQAITAVSELARNIYLYARTGEIRMELSEAERTLTFLVIASDHGPGIAHLQEILAGTYRSRTGLGRGLAGVRTLLDEVDIQTGPEGTTIRGIKRTRIVDLARTT